MKIQDIIFLVIVIILILKRNSQYAVFVGLICLLVSIPLFGFWIFFTAERFVAYSVGFFLLGIFFLLTKPQTK